MIPWGRKWPPTPVFLPGKSHERRSLAGIVHGVTESQTQLSNFISLNFKAEHNIWHVFSVTI